MVSLAVLSSPTPDQIHQIISLYRYEGWWSEETDDPELVSGIVAGSYLFIIALKEDEIVGMGRAISDGTSDAYIQDVTVKKAYRGQGIGTTIINELIKGLRADGIGWIGLIAEKGSHGFYTRLGFHRMQDSVPLLNQRP
ncbi:MAG TPA: GNAT family N-acetyltransferase [Deltaproteobacteria bacterium]|nr:GNAT family N-acetyltransferase [Deltaproteobacteria bacterium]